MAQEAFVGADDKNIFIDLSSPHEKRKKFPATKEGLAEAKKCLRERDITVVSVSVDSLLDLNLDW